MTISTELLMKKTIGKIHFIGIGGIGMSGIAEILHNLGYDIQGSDISQNYNVKRLSSLGIKIFDYHHNDNVNDASVIVKSTDIKDSNIEIIQAKLKKIPIVKRSEMLAELMRLKLSIAISGSHGKTTTTSLTATMFEAAGLNPTVINGGIINSKNTNAYLGSGDYLIAEADESDATFIKVPATIGVVTNIDQEHINFYQNFDNLKNAFVSFIENLPFYGFGVLCIDHDVVREIYEKIIDKKIITYGIESVDADVRAINIKEDINGSHFDILISKHIGYGCELIENIFLPTPGIHNVLNSLSVIAIALELKFNKEIIQTGFNEFKGVKRRFTKVDIVNDITIIDDYAHHPKEITAILKTTKSVLKNENNKIIAVFQPHRYSRVSDLFKEFASCFDDIDTLIISDIYSAGEVPIEEIDKTSLANAIRINNPSINVIELESPEDLPGIITNIAKSNDTVIFLGAGTVTNWAYSLPAQLREL